MAAAYEDRDLIFATGLGGPLDPNDATNGFAAVMRLSRVWRITLHGTRHVAASYALASVADISRHMGHSRLQLHGLLHIATGGVVQYGPGTAPCLHPVFPHPGALR